jgi:DNA replication protein DnaC
MQDSEKRPFNRERKNIYGLGDAAYKNGFMVLYCQMTKRLREISAAQADGSHYKLLNCLSKIRLLILDDRLLYGLSLTQTSDRVFLAT